MYGVSLARQRGKIGSLERVTGLFLVVTGLKKLISSGSKFSLGWMSK